MGTTDTAAATINAGPVTDAAMAIHTGMVRDAPIRVLIPSLLRSYTLGLAEIDIEMPCAASTINHETSTSTIVSGSDAVTPVTLATVMDCLDVRFPGLRFRVIDEQGSIRPHIKMFANRVLVRELAAPIAAGTIVMIVGALSGG